MPRVVPDLVGERYRLRERLAAGGVGEVWRAEDTMLGRTVAVKLLRPEHADSAEYRERLRMEGRHLAALSHPRLAGVYDYGDGGGRERPYLVMELIDGEPLSAVLARSRTLPPRRVVAIVAQAAEGLACVHAAGLVHRDVKPANLLVQPDGSVKITDFGIARGPETLRLTRTGQVIGTPLYLSPEQAAGYGVAPAGDLYSLGVIAWECLAGRPPFEGDDVLAVALAHRDRPVPPLPDGVPAPVRALVRALTAKDAAARPDAVTTAQWARRLLDDPEVVDAAPGPVVPAEQVRSPAEDAPEVRDEVVAAPPNRRSLLLGVGAVAFAAVSGASGWALRSPSEEGRPNRGRTAAASPATGRRTVTVDPARYYGHPVTTVTRELDRMGLRVGVRYQPVPGRPTGTVVGITPAGEISVGVKVTVYAARNDRPAPARAAEPPHHTRGSADSTKSQRAPAGSERHGTPTRRSAEVSGGGRATGKRTEPKGTAKGKGKGH
jgi:eukaryotic-like serine/threonine-protein kinase